MKLVRTIALALAGLVAAKPPVEARAAVIVDKNTDLAQYSQFFEDAELLLDAVTVVDVKDKSFDLFTYGYQAYDMVILFPPQVKCEYRGGGGGGGGNDEESGWFYGWFYGH